MRHEKGGITGDLPIADDLHLQGVAMGDVEVRPGGELRLAGTIVGNLLVDAGAVAIVTRAVAGNLMNLGVVHGSGRVNGLLVDKTGAAFIAPGARIHKFTR